MSVRGYRLAPLIRQVWSQVMHDNVLGMAAQTAYYFFFSLFPLMLFLTPLFSLVGEKQKFVNFLMEQLGRALPPDSYQLLHEIVTSVVYSTSAPGLMSIGAILALWSGSNVFGALTDALNRAYNVQETRPWWKTRLLAIAMVLLSGAAIIVATVTLMAGTEIVEWVAGLLHLDRQTATLIKLVQYSVALLFLFGVGFLTYLLLPCERQRKSQVLIGTTVATILWVIVTLGFRFYVVNFADYNKTYGTIGGIIVLLTWMYLSMLVILVGGELNSELHKGTGRATPRGGTLDGAWVSHSGTPMAPTAHPSVERTVRVRG